jgi:hypothetical protein
MSVRQRVLILETLYQSKIRIFFIVIGFRQQNLCVDIIKVKSVQHVSDFQPSSGIVHATLTCLLLYYFGLCLRMGIFCVVSRLYISAMPLYADIYVLVEMP